MEPILKEYEYQVKSLQMIETGNFMILTETNDIRLLSVQKTGANYFEDQLILRENTHEIVKMLANKNNLFVMCQNGS